MKRSTKNGVVAGVIGAVVGAFCWVVILGIVIHEPLLIFLPIIWGLICVYGFIKFWDVFVDKKYTIIGMMMLWLIIPNIIFFNIYYDKIPEKLYYGDNALLRQLLSTNKSQFSPLIVNIFLGIFIIAGCAFILYGIVKEHTAENIRREKETD